MIFGLLDRFRVLLILLPYTVWVTEGQPCFVFPAANPVRFHGGRAHRNPLDSVSIMWLVDTVRQ